jgi:hypothetical protein
MVTPTGGGMITFKAFGVAMWIATNRWEVRERLPEILPPGWEHAEHEEAKHRLGILGDDRGTYGVDLGGAFLLEGVPLDLALETMDSVVRRRIAEEAVDRIFVHAGVVAYGGTAMLIPGGSFTGKTTLVAALVRAGAVYYSDEFAPLDSDGLVHPYAKPLSLRDADQLQTDHHVESLGGIAGEGPLPVGAVVVTTFRPGARWRPRRLSPGRGALALVSHTVPARERPAQSLHAITRAVDGAVLLEGDRGEADAIAPLLLAELEARAA